MTDAACITLHTAEAPQAPRLPCARAPGTTTWTTTRACCRRTTCCRRRSRRTSTATGARRSLRSRTPASCRCWARGGRGTSARASPPRCCSRRRRWCRWGPTWRTPVRAHTRGSGAAHPAKYCCCLCLMLIALALLGMQLCRRAGRKVATVEVGANRAPTRLPLDC